MGRPPSDKRVGDYKETADGTLAVFKIPKQSAQERRRQLATEIPNLVTKLPNLGPIYRITLPGLPQRIILVDRNQDAEKEITKIADLDSFPISSSDFLRESEAAIKAANPSAVNYRTSVLLERNGVKVVKFGRFLLGYNGQLCAVYEPEINASKLQAVWDGDKPDVYYRTHHPAEEAIVVKSDTFEGRYCSRKKLGYLRSMVEGAVGAFSIDPVSAFGPNAGNGEAEGTGIPCRLFFQKEGVDLFAITSNYVFKFVENSGRFSAVMSLANGNGTAQPEPHQLQNRILGPSCVLF